MSEMSVLLSPGAGSVSAASPQPVPDVDGTAARRTALVASLVGTTVEWYDFFLYATAVLSVGATVLLNAR